jgi:hypothetical protein
LPKVVKATRKGWEEFKDGMECSSININVLANGIKFAKSMVDSGCLVYAICSPRFAKSCNLERLKIKPRALTGAKGVVLGWVQEVTCMEIDVDGHVEKLWAYIMDLSGYDMYLGLPWMRANRVVMKSTNRGHSLKIRSSRVVVRSTEYEREERRLQVSSVSATTFTMLAKRRSGQVFSASMADINRALAKKVRKDPRELLPQRYHQFLDVFDRNQAEKLPPVRGKGKDHSIELIPDDDGKRPEVPWGPLYSMSRDELLVLRKTLTEMLDKGFIRVSNSSAAAPVLFVKKPGGGLRFCVDYRALNKITKKDRYPLPLIYETLRAIGHAKYFTKLDVIAAFHKIRIAEGDEWMTAFRTRYGLFEWMVTPFGLANAPSTFQKYINWCLRDYLDEFCSAYVDDILIYTDGTLEEHRSHVDKVLVRLREAGLQIDIDKCEFEVQSTKYLGFIIEVGKGLRMDPEKLAAIRDWEAPTTVKGVRGFLGFANFYRRFIDGFSDRVRALTELTQKGRAFKWSDEADRAFHELKKLFVEAPVLAFFDFDRQTRIETDSSGWCTGATMLQLQRSGLWLPVAFFSKKNSPAQCNYEIHDKELLAVMNALEEWKAELKGVKSFEILTDHKNLEYFMTSKKLTERQVRWSLELAEYNFKLTYIPGKENERADALSRRDQDMPKDAGDERIEAREMTLLSPSLLASSSKVCAVNIGSANSNRKYSALVSDTSLTHNEELPLVAATNAKLHWEQVGESAEYLQNWERATIRDPTYQSVKRAVDDGARKVPSKLALQISLSECSVDEQGHLWFRGRRWVPDYGTMRTQIIQTFHDSAVGGHPGRELTYAGLAREYYWPCMSNDVRRFCSNCDSCGANKAWRQRRQGLLKPLPIPERIWSEVSIDFITDLPESNGAKNIVLVTDRLGKGYVGAPLAKIDAESLAEWFLSHYYPHHHLPTAIVSDRGTQFVSAFWARVCAILRIKRRLSTAYSPTTDGATERANQEVETYLREFVSFKQDDWASWLGVAIGSLNARSSAATGLSPFFMTHGWDAESNDFVGDLSKEDNRASPVAAADKLLRKLAGVRDWAQAAMADSQEKQEKQANTKRREATSFKVGDKVWLDLKHVRTERPAKKLDAKYAKYEVIELIGSHACRLNTPPGIHDVQPVRRLRLASSNPLPGQKLTDCQPLGVLSEGDDDVEFEVEEILKEKNSRFLVKWRGYRKPTWEPRRAIEDLEAFDRWEATSSAPKRKRRGIVVGETH